MLNRIRMLVLLMTIMVVGVFLWILASPTASSDARQRWLDADIQHYHLRGTFSAWFGSAFEFDLVVERGDVIDSSCLYIYATVVSDEPCDAFNPRAYTVLGLFAHIDTVTDEIGTHVEIPITYDATFGFPRSITYDDPQRHDEEYSITITAFEILDE